MTRSVYVIGPPGVGKSTLMEGLLAGYTRLAPVKVPSPPRTTSLVFEPLVVDRAGEGLAADALCLGYRRKQFSGTDALGMSVNPQAVAWANTGAATGWREIWGEGARLANRGFLLALDRHTDLTVVELVAGPMTLDARCFQRGSAQSVSWRNGAATRARNLSSALMMNGVRVVTIDADRPAADVLDDVSWRLSR